jgi:nicotinate phosphoribosyltransferase
MADFVSRALHPDSNDWIVRSLLDVDFYKPNMDYYEAEFLPDVQVTYGLINRSSQFPLALMVDEGEFRRQLDHVRELTVSSTEAAFLSGMDAYGTRLFPERQIDRFKKLRLCEYKLDRDHRQYKFTVSGPNRDAISWWETIAMSILLELKTRAVLKFMKRHEVQVLYARATDKLYNKLKLLKQYPGIRIVNFGTRRRHSHLWEKFVSEMFLDVLGPQLSGVSNVLHAMQLGLTPMGTNAHQLPMQHVTLAYPDPEAMRQAPYQVLRNWSSIFPKPLRIELQDAYTTAAYHRYMPNDLAYEIARTYRGARQDSGDPSEECKKQIAWYKRHEADPREKLYIFSDGLTHTEIVRLYLEFAEQIMMSFGWGTNATNDFHGCHPDADAMFTHLPGVDLTWDQALSGMSLVCKVVEVNGIPAVKLSNNPKKATGPREIVDHYKEVFGVGEQVAKEPLV